MRVIDSFPVSDIVAALRTITISDKATALLRALATAPDRAMSRLELARAIGSDSVNSCNSVYGTFAKNLATALDPTLADEWKPNGGSNGDWVMFLSWQSPRWTEALPEEKSSWVFVMREHLAQALDRAGIAAYVGVSDQVVRDILETNGSTDVEEEEDDRPPNPLQEIDEAENQLADLTETEREAIILARVGQGRFRDAVVSIWNGRCAVTGVSVLPALVASHIKPWALSSNEERLDAANGLLLVGTLDRLFDIGLIAFDKSCSMLISPRINETDRGLLGLDETMHLRLVPDGCAPFLAWHRRNAFLSDLDD